MTSVVQTNDGHGALVGGGLSFAGNVAIGNSIAVWICDYNTSGAAISTATPTYNGAPVTGAVKLLEIQSTASGTSNIMYTAVYLLPNVQSAAKAVGITAPTNGNNDVNSHYYIAEIAGLGGSPTVDSASPNPATNFGDSSGTLTSGATGAAAGASGIALGAMMQDGASSGWTAPGGWTALTESFGGAAYQIFTSSGAAYTWNPTGTGAGQWAAGAVIVDATPGITPAVPDEPPPLIPPHPQFIELLLGEAWQRADWQAQGVADLTVAFSSTSGGVDTYNVTSPYNGTGAHPMRVLRPTAPSGNYPHAILIMLPVDTDQDTTFGDSIGIAQSISAHNAYNLTIIQPGYAGAGAGSPGPWYADNPLDQTIYQETFTLKVLAWIKANLATTGTERVYLIGFSRSGLGGQGLLFRHPDLFAAVASWDAPFMMTDYDGTDPTNGSSIGGSPANVYGTSSNFTTKYQLSAAHLAIWKASGQYGVNRIWIGLGPAFASDPPAYDAALTAAGIPHTYGFSNTVESHAWQTDWVAAALASIIPSNSVALPASPLMPPGLLSPAAWQFPRYRRLGQLTTISGGGGVVLPKPSLSGAGVAGVPSVVLPASPLMPPGLLSPAAWQFPRYRRLGQAVTITGSGGVVLPKPTLAGSGLLTVTGSGGVILPKPTLSGSGAVVLASIARPPLMPPGLLSPAAWQFPRYRRLGQAASAVAGITGTGGVALPKPSLSGASPVPVASGPVQGGWWQLHSIIEYARQEREFYAQLPPMACPRCGEPMRPAPPSDSGSEVELYCLFDGFQYPRDWTRPAL